MAVFPEGFVDIQGSTPQLTLTDTDPNAKSLRIDVEDPNIAQIREKAGVDNSLITLDLVNNRVGIKKSPAIKELEINGAVDISSIAPSLTLTDTDVGAKSLKIDVNNNIAQIREKASGENSLLSFDLAKNQITVFDSPTKPIPSTTALFTITKDPMDASELSLFFALPVLKTNTQASNFFRTAGCGVDIFGAITIGKIVGFEATCVIATAGGTATFANAINAFCTALLNTQITNSHIINILPSNVPDNVPPNPPIPKINTIPNSIAVRIAKQFEVTPPRARDYGIYYGSHAEGSEPSGTFAIYADIDNSSV